MLIIYFSVDFKLDIEIELDYHDWNYVKTIVILTKNNISKIICLNINVDVILIDKKFLKFQTFDTQIRIIIIFLTIRELNINKYQSVKYVILLIYIIDKNNVNNDVRTCFRRKAHVVNDLKINIFIKNNVIDVENFSINFQKKKRLCERM